MERENLYNVIKCIQKGTNLHIGVLFFGSHGNEMCELPREHHIHSGSVCTALKSRSSTHFKRCFKCRNLALQKALTTKKPFGGICINGIYEYTHPVIINDDVACVIFIGNILDSKGQEKLFSNLKNQIHLIDSMEKEFEYDEIVTVAKLLESYIITLLEKYSRKNTNTNPLIENIKNYICSNLEFDIDIEQIAKIFHYNKTYLGRLFKSENGMNIKDYVNTQRIEKAKQLLKNSSESIISVSSRVGFNSVTYFNRVFKAETNLTPSQYRKILTKDSLLLSKEY